MVSSRIQRNCIQQVRKRTTNLTAKQVCKAIGITIYTYGNYERNHSQPNDETLEKIAKFFGVSSNDLVVEDKINVLISVGKNEVQSLAKLATELYSNEELSELRTELGELYFKGDIEELRKQIFWISNKVNKSFKFLETEDLDLYFTFINNLIKD